VTLVSFAVEGQVDIPIAERLIRYAGLEPRQAVVAGGAEKLDRRIPDLLRSANHLNWLILRDLDRGRCAPEIVRHLVEGKTSPRASVRIPVRAIESWILADMEGFEETFSIHRSRLPDRPDDLPNPKVHLVNVCRRSRQSTIRRAIPPQTGSRRAVGPEYVNRISLFARDIWDPERAATHSPSLRRAMSALRRMVAEGIWS